MSVVNDCLPLIGSLGAVGHGLISKLGALFHGMVGAWNVLIHAIGVVVVGSGEMVIEVLILDGALNKVVSHVLGLSAIGIDQTGSELGRVSSVKIKTMTIVVQDLVDGDVSHDLHDG